MNSYDFWKKVKYVYCLEFGMVGKIELVWDSHICVSYYDSWIDYSFDGDSLIFHILTGDNLYKRSSIVPIHGLVNHRIGNFYL